MIVVQGYTVDQPPGYNHETWYGHPPFTVRLFADRVRHRLQTHDRYRPSLVILRCDWNVYVHVLHGVRNPDPNLPDTDCQQCCCFGPPCPPQSSIPILRLGS